MNPQALRQRRENLKITRAVLARLAGTSATHIYRLETNRSSNPTLRTWSQIESALARLERERQRPSDGEAA